MDNTMTALQEFREPDQSGTVPLRHGAGIIVIDKPRGPTSHQVAAWVGKMLGCQIGHAGTLDPQVSGILLVMLGNAVRLAPLLLKHDKEYVCLMRLHKEVDRQRIDEIAAEFTGRIYQRPPRRSAVKRLLRIRTIQQLDVLGVEGRLVLMKVRCDAGTYIRSLCHHMGLALGVGAHMQELRRTRSGAFDEHVMHTLHDLQDACAEAAAGNRAALDAMVVSVDAAVPDLPTVIVRDTAIDALCHGAVLAGVGVIRCDEFKKDQIVAVLSQKREFVGLGKALAASASWKPGKNGLFVAMTTVFLAPGTYPKGWKKGCPPEKPKKPVH
ncbi:RNA-guided pseudouridylation complex pseudouridine synthase subunit Cbf5 [Methanoregula sp.]|uniref:RNA-guided pseudouridylation complex pseudouridine synthase subunit Cbf5 n=1 Tax=Methanoregula sp. TaxID=2052170 RepID=UPI003BAFDE47